MSISNQYPDYVKILFKLFNLIFLFWHCLAIGHQIKIDAQIKSFQWNREGFENIRAVGSVQDSGWISIYPVLIKLIFFYYSLFWHQIKIDA